MTNSEDPAPPPVRPMEAQDDLAPILRYAEAGDLEAIKRLEEAELPKALRSRDPDRRTPLHRACAGGHAEVVSYLLDKGADVNCTDEEGWTPLHSVSSMGHSMVDLLLDRHADPNAVTSSGAVALHFAASKGHLEVVRSLLSAGAKVDVRDRHRGTPLLRAVATGKKEVVQLLLEAAADVGAKDKVGDNLMHVAVNGQHLLVLDLLMSLDSVEKLMTQENEEKKTPVQMILEMQPITVRDTIKSIWKDKRGG